MTRKEKVYFLKLVREAKEQAQRIKGSTLYRDQEERNNCVGAIENTIEPFDELLKSLKI